MRDIDQEQINAGIEKGLEPQSPLIGYERWGLRVEPAMTKERGRGLRFEPAMTEERGRGLRVEPVMTKEGGRGLRVRPRLFAAQFVSILFTISCAKALERISFSTSINDAL